MNIPENFHKINNQTLTLNEYEFYLEFDTMYNGNVYVFPYDKSRFNDCLWFQIDWCKLKFSVKKCELGKGNFGSDLILDEPFQKKIVITKTTFINKLIGETIDYLIKNKLY